MVGGGREASEKLVPVNHEGQAKAERVLRPTAKARLMGAEECPVKGADSWIHEAGGSTGNGYSSVG